MFIPNKSFKFQGVYYNTTPPTPSPLATPFTVKALEDGASFGIYNDSGATYINLQYSKNGGAWTPVIINQPISIDQDETIAFSGTNPSGFSNGTGDFKFKGSSWMGPKV